MNILDATVEKNVQDIQKNNCSFPHSYMSEIHMYHLMQMVMDSTNRKNTNCNNNCKK